MAEGTGGYSSNMPEILVLYYSATGAVRSLAQSVARGIDSVEMSWILENNAGMRNIIETIGGRVSKRYRMYEKNLAATTA